jgi:hypothetical protein
MYNNVKLHNQIMPHPKLYTSISIPAEQSLSIIAEHLKELINFFYLLFFLFLSPQHCQLSQGL